MQPIRFGILATGDIASRVVESIKCTEGAEAYAVASRDLARAQAFAQKHSVQKAYGSYEAMLEDPAVDIVYVATPHSHHYENMMQCIAHGKHILCEKSFTVNAAQAREVVEKARAKRLFVMECMWIRFCNGTNMAVNRAKEPDIGDIRMVSIIFGRVSPDVRGDADRYNRAALAGGALLDLGCYTTNAAQMIFGDRMPTKVVTSGYLKDGIDEQGSIILEYGPGQTVTMQLAFRSHMTRHFSINGTDGKVEAIFPKCDQIHVQLQNGQTYALEANNAADNFVPYLTHVVDCLRKGLTESPIMPPKYTVRVMEILDEVRRQWGLRYPSKYE
nr:Gfo/Idh/MocA family oxidoreductase [Maliibacterium massiliense]